MEQGITIFHKDENLRPQQPEPPKPKRGPLNLAEQLTLIEICRKHASAKDVSHSSTNFWIKIEVELQSQIGRRYSHASCRRRIVDYISERRMCLDAIKLGLQPYFETLPEPVRLRVDDWINASNKPEGDAQVKPPDTLAKLGEFTLQLPRTDKMKRVADWVRSVPEQDPSMPRPFSGLVPTLAEAIAMSKQKQERQRQERERRERERLSHPGLFSGPVAQTRPPTTAKVTPDSGVVKREPESPARVAPAHLPSLAQPLPTPLTKYSPISGGKRPRDRDELEFDRAARRPRLDLITPSFSELKTNGTSEYKLENITGLQSTVETVFSKFWDHMLPHFKERELKQGLSVAKSETIMHELFKDVGAALMRAFIKLEEGAPAS